MMLIERQFNKQIKAVQCDIGGEFLPLAHFLKHYGVIVRFSCPCTHQQNVLVE